MSFISPLQVRRIGGGLNMEIIYSIEIKFNSFIISRSHTGFVIFKNSAKLTLISTITDFKGGPVSIQFKNKFRAFRLFLFLISTRLLFTSRNDSRVTLE